MKVLIALGILFRLALIQHPTLPGLIGSRIEVATPLTSFKRLKEGIHLFRNNIDPYEGGPFHQPPLILALFHILPQVLTPYLFPLIDLLTSILLLQIAKTYKYRPFPPQPEKDETVPVDTPLDPEIAAAVYLLNPWTLAACVGRSTGVVTSLAVVAGVYFATRGRRVGCMVSLAFAAYCGVWAGMLVLPCGLLIAGVNKTKQLPTLLSGSVLFATFTFAYLLLSNLLMGSWFFLSSTYGTLFLVPDLTPNIGLSWYIFIEMFDQFRLFFLLVFQIFVVAFCVPLSIKFNEQPLLVVTLLLVVTSAFKSYPEVGDVGLYVPFVFMHQELFKYMKNLYLITHLALAATILLPLFYNLWIYAGSGNANFFYAITLVVGVGQVLLIGDLIAASLRREWEREGPGVALRKKRVEVTMK
ncbi:PIG-U-domain-containing protein [Rhizoclosmatium globosum]|uniref:PIG-U-domain-containing protein n=1 Tax=Rhizoclosmatium globosum TaxID=329046 RepID=A0A1Y2BI51_9FUNG|nr:PIG-U-domain-containing protein [Rhizoclosmatium globosum]|eukprot:ORY34468.1 PIG-U-domain-containing protein [Rhizoclosmatium globosum]